MIPIMMQIGAGSTALSIKFLEEQSAPLPMIPIKKIRTAINIFIMKVLFYVAMYNYPDHFIHRKIIILYTIHIITMSCCVIMIS